MRVLETANDCDGQQHEPHHRLTSPQSKYPRQSREPHGAHEHHVQRCVDHHREHADDDGDAVLAECIERRRGDPDDGVMRPTRWRRNAAPPPCWRSDAALNSPCSKITLTIGTDSTPIPTCRPEYSSSASATGPSAMALRLAGVSFSTTCRETAAGPPCDRQRQTARSAITLIRRRIRVKTRRPVPRPSPDTVHHHVQLRRRENRWCLVHQHQHVPQPRILTVENGLISVASRLRVRHCRASCATPPRRWRWRSNDRWPMRWPGARGSAAQKNDDGHDVEHRGARVAGMK